MEMGDGAKMIILGDRMDDEDDEDWQDAGERKTAN